jgi:hypothetical protein
VLSTDSRTIAGVILLTIVAIEYGGWFMLRHHTWSSPSDAIPADFFPRGPRARWRARDACAYLPGPRRGSTDAGPLSLLACNGIPAAAVLMPAGYFLSAAGRDITSPNRLILLVYAGVIALGLGVISLGIGLLAG